MTEFDWQARFPELQPIQSLPGLWHFMGCGMLFRGRRDVDEETNSYITTHCLCILGLPVLAFRAYRVVDAPKGKYIMGREPLSIPARAFSVFALLAAIIAGGLYCWDLYTRSPAYIARQKLEQGDALAAGGQVAEAARLYREVALGTSSPKADSSAAVERVRALLERSAAPEPLSELAGVIATAVALDVAGRWPQPASGLYQQAMALQAQRAASDPAGGLAIVDAVAPLAPQAEDINTVRRGLLEKLVTAHPSDVDLASRLAAVYEAQGHEDLSVKLLEPLRTRLGTSEGARILGIADARHDRFESALLLLRPYTQARLDSFRAAETALASAVQTAQQDILEHLRNERPSEFDFERYSGSTEAERSAQLELYVTGKLKGDPDVEAAQERLAQVSSVVPAALELGTILLQRAQGQTDPKARKADLDDAERYFLAVGSFAGDNQAVQLNLAQVYYWQGKHREGKSKVDDVLKAGRRDPSLLLQVSEMLRQVGSDTDAKTLAEEAYNSAQASELKQNAAIQRGLLTADLDEKVLWLGRGNPSHPAVKAMLSEGKAEQAISRGDDATAIAQLREAAGLYDSMPESPQVLNNAAITLFRLANLTGDQQHYERGLTKIERASKLDPKNVLTMANAGTFLLQEALRDVIGPSIDVALLKDDPDVKMLSFLYNDVTGRKAIVERVRSHSGVNRAIGMLDKAVLLAPGRDGLYKLLNDLYAFRGEVDRQRALVRRLEQAALDQSAEIARWREYLSGSRDDELHKRATANFARDQATLDAARAKKHQPTFAAAAAGAVRNRYSSYAIGLDADRDAAVALAEEAYAAAPSYGSRSALITSLLFRAGGRLARSQPAYAKLEAKTRRSTGDAYLIGFVLGADSPVREAASIDPDVRRAIDLVREAYRQDPQDEASAWAWSLLRAVYPQDAAKMAETYLKDESSQISRAIKRRVEPCDASVPLNAYWVAQMQGKVPDSRPVIEEYAARGVPLPVEAP
jgi:hypothetical protein